MNVFIRFIIFMTISYTICVCDYNFTVLFKKRHIKDIDVLRQIINQETLIRLSLVKDVKKVVDDIGSVKRSMVSTERMVSIQQQTLETLRGQVATLSQDDTLAKKMEIFKKQIDNLNQNNSLQQTVETLKRQIDFLRRDDTLVNSVESLKRELKIQKQENRKKWENCENRFKEIDQKFTILNGNITDIYYHFNRTEVQTLEKGVKLKRDCKDHYLLGHTRSGVYEINPIGFKNKVLVYCDMVTAGGGWTVIQKRVSGSVSFNKKWDEYKKGFGNPNDSYWIGNDVIHQMTKGKNSSLYVSITLKNGKTLYKRYQQFSVSGESDKYRLYLGGPASGTLAGDRMLNTGRSDVVLSGMYFSTPERDNDRSSSTHCAAYWRGGWWFNACHQAYLNGPWNSEGWPNIWYPLITSGTSVKKTVMMIKLH